MTPEEVAEIRARHRLVEAAVGVAPCDACDDCEVAWPCEVVRLLDALQERTEWFEKAVGFWKEEEIDWRECAEKAEAERDHAQIQATKIEDRLSALRDEYEQAVEERDTVVAALRGLFEWATAPMLKDNRAAEDAYAEAVSAARDALAGLVPEEHVCPECRVERADYEGPNGAHLPECPNCGSKRFPVSATDVQWYEEYVAATGGAGLVPSDAEPEAARDLDSEALRLQGVTRETAGQPLRATSDAEPEYIDKIREAKAFFEKHGVAVPSEEQGEPE